jgi:Malate/L-lactate dehydrogenase
MSGIRSARDNPVMTSHLKTLLDGGTQGQSPPIYRPRFVLLLGALFALSTAPEAGAGSSPTLPFSAAVTVRPLKLDILPLSVDSPLLIETLSGVLTGAAFRWRVGNWMWDDGTQPTCQGAAFLAIDTKAIMPAAEFARRMEALVDEIHAAPRAEGVERLWVPGEREWEHHRRAVRTGSSCLLTCGPVCWKPQK